MPALSMTMVALHTIHMFRTKKSGKRKVGCAPDRLAARQMMMQRYIWTMAHYRPGRHECCLAALGADPVTLVQP